MFEKEYEKLINYIEEMISDGVQLIHGGQLFDWSDTKIVDQIAKIKELKGGVEMPKLQPGDRLKHKVSGQEMWVINDDGKTVFLNPDSLTIKFPLDKIMQEFTIVNEKK